MLAGLEADIRKIAPACGIMSDLNLSIEEVRVAFENSIDKVGLMPGTAVSFELFDDFAVVIVDAC